MSESLCDICKNNKFNDLKCRECWEYSHFESNETPLHEFVRLCRENGHALIIKTDSVQVGVIRRRWCAYRRRHVTEPAYETCPHSITSPEALEWLKGILKEKE